MRISLRQIQTNKRTGIKMKKVKHFIKHIALFILAACLFQLQSCKEEALDESIIEINSSEETELDSWIDSTFRVPYNIYVEYKWNSSDVDQSKVVVPPKVDLVKPFLQTVLKIWLKTYTSVADMGDDFMRTYPCRKLKLIGSGSYNSGSVTLGLAENGYKITLYTINDFNLESGISRSELREYFRVMHHEYGHILNQRTPYDADFQNITGGYTSDWTSLSNAESRELGFISAYARSADTEDFVETLSYYITYTNEEWTSLLQNITSEEAVENIELKVQAVAGYMKDAFGVDVLELRNEITTSIDEVVDGNLE